MTSTTEDTSTKQQAQQAASTAADEGRHVAGAAKQEATQVASEAAGAAKNVAQDAVQNFTAAAAQPSTGGAGGDIDTTSSFATPPAGGTYVPDPATSVSTPGQPTIDPLTTPDPSILDGPETGYSGGVR